VKAAAAERILVALALGRLAAPVLWPGTGRRRFFAVAVAAILGLPGDGWGGGPPGAAPELGRRAPDFTLPDLAGKPVRLADFQGKKAVLVNFWATWCPPCREEMPTLERLAKARRETLQVLGVNLDAVSQARVRAFVRELGITFPILLDPELAVGKTYRVRGLPTSFVVDRDGVVRFREIGYRDWTDHESQFVIDQALRGR